MGLKCSLVGHDLGAPDTERDREERGDEVVVTIREVRRCNRCDAERVVSESTEVRPVRSAPDSVAGEETDTDTDGEATGSTADTGAAGTDTDPGTGSDAGPSDTTGPAPAGGGDGAADPTGEPEPAVERVAGEGPDATGDPEPVGDTEAAADPETDDAVILEDDEPEPEPERDPGEWPDAEDTRLEDDEPATPTAEAVREATDEAGSDGDAPTDGVEAGPDPADDAADQPDLGSGAWPDPRDGADEGYDATAPGDGAADTDDGEMIAAAEGDAGGAVEAGGGSTTTAAGAGEGAGPAPAAGVLVCPSCGFEEPSRGSSHRGGDVCPDCKRGYLSERSA